MESTESGRYSPDGRHASSDGKELYERGLKFEEGVAVPKDEVRARELFQVQISVWLDVPVESD
jgi:hypothetical protein